ncbi:MAG TPA: efflux RND transporter periplasmic adaptor subunit [Candidatus Obscuribacterales bacterium]
MAVPLDVLRIFVTLFVCGVTLAGCSSAQPMMGQPQIPAALVKTQPVINRVVAETSTYVATLKSRKSVSLKPQVSGRILRIDVKSGDTVASGAAIVELDRSKQEALVANCAAGIESSLADRKNAEATLKSLKASKLSKISNVRFAETQYERYKKLYADGAVSAESVDQQRNQLNVNQSELDAIEAQIKAQEAVILKDEKQINMARANLREQEEQLKYFTLRAPFAGMIGDVPVKVGDYVDTDTVLTTIDQNRPLELYVSVPIAQAGRLRKGLAVEIIDNDGAPLQEATIAFVSPQVDNKDQSVLAKAEIANADGTFRSGQIVNAKVIWDQVAALMIPVTAVSRYSGRDFVYLAQADASGNLQAKQRAVKLGEIQGNEYRVLSGLSSGETIISSGVQTLADGMPIRTRK